jgi:D-alanyl-D-alanine carboxypeptidase-like protein
MTTPRKVPRAPKVAKRPTPVVRKPAVPLSPAQKLAAVKAAAAKKAAARALLLKRRQSVGTAKSLLPKAAEKGKGFEILIEKIVRLPAKLGGHRMLVLIPKGCDGGVDMYFPGGASGIDLALKRDNLKGKWIAAGKKGKRRALVILEGKVTSRYGYKQKYAYMSGGDALQTVLTTINGTHTAKKISNVHVIGHSMGGQGIHHAVSQPGVTGATCLDSTYWSHKPIVDLARRGGRVNVVFRPGTDTAAVAKRIISKLGLTKKAPGKWESKDGKVKVYATRLSHGGLVNPFVGMFMGASSTPVRTFSRFIDRYEGRGGYGGMSLGEIKEIDAKNPAGALHKKYLERVKKITAQVAALDVKTLQGSSITDVRYNPRLLKKRIGTETDKEQVANVKSETERRIRAYTSAYDGKWYTLDYAKMGSDRKGRSHEDFVGLADVIIDPSVMSVVVDRGGKLIVATRGVVKSGRHKGRVGFVDGNGKYVYSNTGDKFRMTTKVELPDEKLLASYKVESLQRDEHEKTWKAGGDAGIEGSAVGGMVRSPILSHASARPSDAVSVDTAITKNILDEHRKLYKGGRHKVGGQCEGMAITVAANVKSRVTGDRFKWRSLRRAGLFKKATSKYRGTLIGALQDTDFAKPGESYGTSKIPIGAVMYAALDNPKLTPFMTGARRNEIAPVVRATKRHWWIYAGRDAKGKVMFVDNHWRSTGRMTLAALKKSIPGRKVINIHDPYVNLRGRMYVDKKGSLKEKYVKAKNPKFASSGPASNHFTKRKRIGERLWKNIPEAKFVDDGVSINPRDSFVTGRDGFGNTVILRRGAMRAFYRARQIAESSTPVVRLRVSSSYRSKASQSRINPSGKGTRMVAAPGKSWHQSGGAIDLAAYVQNTNTGKWEGGTRHKNQIHLKRIMPKASFANLPHEMWHWEYGSTRWKKKTGRRTRKYTKVMKLRRTRKFRPGEASA